jgi:hypothetical protein
MEAPAGRGKTITLAQITERQASASTLAFLIHLPSWAQEIPDILEFIAGMEPFTGWLASWLRHVSVR